MFHKNKKDDSGKISGEHKEKKHGENAAGAKEQAECDNNAATPENSTEEHACDNAAPHEAKSGDNNAEASEQPAAGDNTGDKAEAAGAATKDEPVATEEDKRLAALADALLKAQTDLLKTKEAYVRAVADFDNYRRRVNDERPKNMIFAKGDLAKDLFPVLDNFKLGIDAAEKAHPEAKALIEGFAMISAQIKSALAQHGITEITPKVGDKFNPQEHESISCMPSTDVPEEHILFIQRVGYKIGDRLLRPASVVIATAVEPKK
ncbi:MAG: nucleotide exchange factor GrpE [Opitutae bacterium]|nr:nucleotide exchange factor GrpE [Opitutae bacterium]